MSLPSPTPSHSPGRDGKASFNWQHLLFHLSLTSERELESRVQRVHPKQPLLKSLHSLFLRLVETRGGGEGPEGWWPFSL
jgi:hypothetical protein